jgi:hypothetical protein
MITTVTDCPIQQFIEAGTQPEVVFDKRTSESWAVVSRPIRFDGKQPELVVVEQGELVRVPLFAYRTANKELHTLTGFATELGVRAVLAAPYKPVRLHLVLGVPVIDLSESAETDAYRIHLGLAFQLK